MKARLALIGCTLALFLPLAVLVATADGKCRTKACHARHAAYKARSVWKHRFYAQAASWRSWALSTASCESGRRWHIATGNGYYGAHQWLPQTWFSAQRLFPRGQRASRYPHLVSSWQQSVVAITYARRYGTGAWPNCG